MDEKFSLYVHVFPNGKKYVGVSSNPEVRWANGHGYQTQPKVYRAIQKYGWDSIQHNIVVSDLTREQAMVAEKAMIACLDSYNNGYNSTIGGDNIISTYLNSHMLYMIRRTKESDERCGKKEPETDVVQFAYNNRNNKELSDVLNEADLYADCITDYSRPAEYFVDEYWYYVDQYMRSLIKPEAEVKSYPQAVYDYYFKG